MAKVNISGKDVFWVYTSRILTIGVNILLLPVILKFLTEDELGLWFVFSSISQVVTLFDFGFNSTISRHMTYAWCGAEHLEKTSVSDIYGNETNVELVSEIIQTCKIVYFLISTVALITMASVGTLYIFSVIRDGMTRNILLSWVIYIFAVFFNIFYGYWSSLLQGIGAVAERCKMSVYSKFIHILVAVVLIYSGLGLLGVVISYFISGLLFRFIGKYYFNKQIDGLTLIHNSGVDKIKKCFSNVWGTAWKDGIVMLSQYLSTQANTLICAYYIDLSTASVYGLMSQIISIIGSISTSYYSAYQPVFSGAYLRKDTAEQKRILCTTDFIFKVFFLLGIITFYFIGLPIIHIIRPSLKIEIGFIFYLSLFYYIFYQKDLFSSMIAASNDIPYWKSYVVTAMVSIILSVILIKYANLGICGLVAAQLITNAIYNCWRWPLYIMQRVGAKYYDIYYIGYNSLVCKINDFVKRKTI